MDLSNQQVMESNGWVFNITHSMGGYFLTHCGGETWYGWAWGSTAGSLQILLEDSGVATVNYGNCYSNGVVNVFLNNELISSATANVKNKVVNSHFSTGDVLKFTEEKQGIIKLNSIVLKCIRKY